MNILRYSFDIEAKLQKYASIFFSLPNIRWLTILYLIALLFSLVLFRNIEYWIYYFIFVAELIILRKYKLLDLCNTKRLIFAAFFLLILTDFYALMSCSECVILEAIFFYLILEILSTEYTRIKFYIFSFLPVVAFLVLKVLIFKAYSLPKLAFLTAFVLGFYGLMEYSIRNIERKAGYPAFLTLKLFIYWKLENNSRPLEILFYKYSEKRDVTVLLGKLYDKHSRPTGALIFPEFHFGPFDDIGSSNFVGLLTRRFSESRLPVIVFHGLGSHELDIVSRTHVEKLIEKILAQFHLAHKPVYIKFKGPILEQEGDVSCEAIEISGMRFFFISRLARTSDDIPEFVKSLLDLKSNEWVIECQNGYNPKLPVLWDEESIEWLKTCIDRARERLSLEREAYIRLRIWHVPSYVLPKEFENEITDGGISVLEFVSPDTKKILLTIVSVDSNNIMLEKRKMFEKYLKLFLGSERVIVVSTDSHIRTRIHKDHKFYYPLFYTSNPLLLAKFLKEFKDTHPELQSEASYIEWIRIVDLVPLMGEHYYRILKSLEMVGKAALAILGYLFLSLFIFLL